MVRWMLQMQIGWNGAACLHGAPVHIRSHYAARRL
jgi:hypothetical protein